MKGIAKDIIVITYSLIITDERLVQEQEKNKERGAHISDDKVRRAIIRERIEELIGDEKKKSSFFIYEGMVRWRFCCLDSLPLIACVSSVKNTRESFPIGLYGMLSSGLSFL